MRRLSDQTLGALAAMLPAVVICVVFPTYYYLGNHQLLAGVGPAFVVFAGIFVCALALVLSLSTRAGERSEMVLRTLFFFGVYLLFADIVSPLKVGPIAEGDELLSIQEPRHESIALLALAALVFAVGFFAQWNRRVKTFGSVVVCTLLAANLGSLSWLVVSEAAGIASTGPTEGTGSGGGNVYHFVFDEQGADFEELAAELNVREHFDGFTFFPKTLCNSVYTVLSIASFMSGTLPEPDRIKDWKELWQSELGILGSFQALGYRVSDCQSFRPGYRRADVSVKAEDIELGARHDSESAVFIDHVLLRLAPTFLRQELFIAGRGVVSRFLSPAGGAKQHFRSRLEAAAPRSVDMVSRLLREEATRAPIGEYVFAHVMIPHLPYFLDRDLNRRDGGTSYREQSLAAARLMVQIVQRLKELGRYENSTIIFHSDHGRSRGAGDLPVELLKSPDALLLIKRPGASGPLRVSSRAAQLLDLAPTLYALVGIGRRFENGGLDLFSPIRGEPNDVHIINYKSQKVRNVFQHVVYGWSSEWSESEEFGASEASGVPKTVVYGDAVTKGAP